VLGPGGQQRGRYAAGAGVTALARLGQDLALGFADGDIEVLSTAANEKQPTFSPDDASASAVVRILAGPRHTLVVGYADGTVALWHTVTGTRLNHLRLHGPVVHLALLGTRLHAVTELGDHGVLDLSFHYREYCELLREVWRQVPVVWEGGQPVLRPPPGDHRCGRGR
jgi:WD40 repeat protein